ncbi:hypothetical protein OIT41_08745 [Arthrobacter sp. YA7-1]|uniref:hypothetical protein n=1 Tax=Arthrobacter sp. YA7-1 TaxID=2987701 RepID=UPI0022270E2F|nr:hypothetical protein [Arthrobacter sp. YA7-1]UYY83102.1 hypothetical protein OIT41_08745 [Arthrobacter sp. YA7-1]
MAALLDAPVTILMADKGYFESRNCITELGASMGSRGRVFALLSPEIVWEDIPQEFRWIGWRYSHDPSVLTEIRECIEQSNYIDSAPQIQIANYCAWINEQSEKAKENLRLFRQSWPKLKDYRPLPFPAGRPDAVFGLSSWELQSGEVVPVLYAHDDQSSIMNSDKLVEFIKEKYRTHEVFGLWPDESMGVCIHTGGGGTLPHQEEKLAALDLPLLSSSNDAEVRGPKNFFTPHWFEDWEADHITEL